MKDNDAVNRIGPGETHASSRARVMNALVRAMDAAQNWHDICQVADVMVRVDVQAHYMQKEIDLRQSDCAVPAAQVVESIGRAK